MSALIVLLAHPASGSPELAWALSADGLGIQEHGSAPPALLPQPRGADAEVVAVVPGTALSWHRVDLPKGIGPGSPRLRGVLEGLLEERLLDEPEALHFALEPGAANEGAWVAACDRAWLRASLQQLEAAGRPVTRVVPEFAPQEPPLLCALGEPDHALLIWAGPSGVLTLPLAAGSLGLLPEGGADAAQCVAEPAVAAMAEQVLGRNLPLQQAPQRWLRAARSGWNLAQFDFASSGRSRALRKFASGWTELLRAPHWRWTRWGAALLVFLNLIGLNAWAWKEKASLDGKRQAIQRTFTQTFPQVKVVVDAPQQMQRELAALRQRTGVASGRDLESMLAALAVAAPPGRSLSSVEYNGSDLRVRGLALTQDELRPVAANLRSLGYASTLQGDVLVIAQEAAP